MTFGCTYFTCSNICFHIYHFPYAEKTFLLHVEMGPHGPMPVLEWIKVSATCVTCGPMYYLVKYLFKAVVMICTGQMCSAEYKCDGLSRL